MCKFHHDVACDIARRPDGTIDPMAYAINCIALGTNFDIGTYVPTLPNTGGTNKYELACKRGQSGFVQSGLVYDPQAFSAYRSKTLDFLKERTQQAIARNPVDQSTLKRLRSRRRAFGFINTAPDNLYVPFDNLTTGVFRNEKQATIYQSIRLAAADYWQDTDVQEILSNRFRQSVAVTFTEAAQKVNPKLLAVYEAIPEKLRDFTSCTAGMCTTAGIQGLVHIGCLKNAAMVIGGITLGGAMNTKEMLLWSSGASLAGPILMEGVNYFRNMPTRKLTRMLTYGASILGFSGMMLWHTLRHNHQTHHRQDAIPCSPHTPAALQQLNTSTIYEFKGLTPG
jgi:hypothetical protein